MSDVLLDSHVLLWLLDDSPRLGHRARERIATASTVFVSAASTWELGIKASLGKVDLPDGFAAAVETSRLRDLPVTRVHTLAAPAVELPHRDPFDALLVAQAQVEHLTFLTADAKILGAWPEAVDARR